ncbi:MAG: CarD family transcriptional regulator [Eubacteriales bacterium]|nr:CarD family transcriptional regulator [Eubacteriales bacterium]
MFEVGQYVIKANTGVCRVVEITMYARNEEEDEKLFYILAPKTNPASRLYVPVDSDKSNMRPVMTYEEAEAFIVNVPNIEVAWIASDKLREKEYKEAIKSNNPEALVSIIKNLIIRNRQREEQGKKSTAVDERYFQMAENALYSELSTAMDKSVEELRVLISEAIEKI